MQAENRKEELMQALYNELPTAYQENTDTSSSLTNQNNNINQSEVGRQHSDGFSLFDFDKKSADNNSDELPFGDESSNPFSNSDIFSDDANFKDDDSDDEKSKRLLSKTRFCNW